MGRRGWPARRWTDALAAAAVAARAAAGFAGCTACAGWARPPGRASAAAAPPATSTATAKTTLPYISAHHSSGRARRRLSEEDLAQHGSRVEQVVWVQGRLDGAHRRHLRWSPRTLQPRRLGHADP